MAPDTIGFGELIQLDQNSCKWKLTVSKAGSTLGSESAAFHQRDTLISWRVELKRFVRPEEHVMFCSVLGDWNQSRMSRYFTRYRLSIVDDSSQEMWSKTVHDSFVTHRSVRGQGRLLHVPSGIICAVKGRLNASMECFVKLDFINKDIEALSEAVKELLLDEEDFDVILSVQGREFKAHKIFLKARSAVFKRMFAHDMLEQRSGRVEIEDCDPDVFALFLRFLYTGKADGLTEKNVAPLYHFADKYDVPSLCKVCVLFVNNNFDVEEFGDFAEIACLNKEDLFSSTVEFMAENFQEIAKTVKWKAFMRKNTEWANELHQEVHGHLLLTYE